MPYWNSTNGRSPELGREVFAAMVRRMLIWLAMIGVIVVGGWVFG